jgi:ATP-dependent metalloprotease
MEKTANNNPQSATAQNAFYQALLRADMPQIVIERYQSGRYATSAACDAAFVRALERVGQAGGLKASNGSLGGNMQSGSLSDAQIQAIAQAIAAHTRGTDAAISRNSDGSPDLGNKDKPIYVVTKDTLGSIIFKWFRLFLSYGVGIYLSLMIVSMFIENMGAGVKRLSQIQNNEAQPQHQTARFSDVHGCEEAKEELQELVDFLKSPDKFSALGGKMPKGVLLVGPPGTGKTLLARAVAGEAGVPFFFMSGSEFEEVYVGVGAKRVRELFNAARAKAPAIIFIDELDAVGAKRNERDSAYAKQTLNQLLTELDGFSQTSGIIILAATNFPQLLDKALTRPGRFDRHVVVPLPDVRGRMAILKHHMKNVQVGTDVDPAVIARGTPGLSGAELENIVNQAAIHASRNKSKKVTMQDFEWAKDKIIMGAERRSAVIQEKDKLMTAYHEGGHALVALSTAGANSLYKVTIMPRGQALGVTSTLPEIDKVSISKSEMQAQIDVLMGGKVAEELVYGSEHVTAGVSSVGCPGMRRCTLLFSAGGLMVGWNRTSSRRPSTPTPW